MTVPLVQMTSLIQAVQYAKEGAVDAAKVCPAAVAAYSSALAQIQLLQDDSWYGTEDEEALARAKAYLASADAKCSAAKVTPPPHYTPTVPKPKPGEPGAPAVPSGVPKKAGFGWLGAAVIAGAGYLLYRSAQKPTRKRKYRGRLDPKATRKVSRRIKRARRR